MGIRPSISTERSPGPTTDWWAAICCGPRWESCRRSWSRPSPAARSVDRLGRRSGFECSTSNPAPNRSTSDSPFPPAVVLLAFSMASDLPTAFEGIDPRLAAAVGRRGIRVLSEIQRLAFPLLRGESDALLLSPTGTGKTEAALLPLLTRRLADPTPPISVLYVTPLRALNRDLEHRLVSLVEEVGLTAAVRHGDTTAAARVAQSRTPPDLLLTTPETLQILMVGVRLREGLRNVRTVVVDEIHELVGSDRGAQLGLTLERLDALAGRKVRRIGLSATVGNPSEVARFLAPVPRVVEVQSAQQRRVLELSARSPADTYPALEPRLQAELKADEPLLRGLRAVEEEVRAHTTTLIFVNTRPTAEGLAA